MVTLVPDSVAPRNFETVVLELRQQNPVVGCGQIILEDAAQTVGSAVGNEDGAAVWTDGDLIHDWVVAVSVLRSREVLARARAQNADVLTSAFRQAVANRKRSID